MKTFKGELMERIGCNWETRVSVRPGSSKVFIGHDYKGRYAGADILISTDDAREMARALLEIADQVDAEIARDAEDDAELEE